MGKPMSRAPANGGYCEWTIGVIPAPHLAPTGIELEWQDRHCVIAWEDVAHAFAAEVGEPEGIRAVVFDLMCTAEVTGAVLLRFSVDPSDGPKGPAQRLVEVLGPKRCSHSLQAVAREGCATDRYSHLDQLDEAQLDAIACCVRADRSR